MLATLPLTYGFIRWSKRMGMRAFETGGRVCWACGYASSGLADSGACPECGRAFTLADLKAKWRTTRLGPLVRDAEDMPVLTVGTPSDTEAGKGVKRPKSAMARTPRFMRRRMIVFFVGMCIIPAGVMGTTLGGTFGKTGTSLPVVIGGQLLLTGVFVGWFVASHRGLIRRLGQTHNRLCLECGYDVSTLPEHGACPECGEPFKHEELRNMWLDVNYARFTRNRRSDRE